ncbi:MAG: hypothetical protein NTY90_05770 [Candidatus Micrarchaeota archaeon]|nr:hypothetical protein [Candidatus Micrarchaeota archaeon]
MAPAAAAAAARERLETLEQKYGEKIVGVMMDTWGPSDKFRQKLGEGNRTAEQEVKSLVDSLRTRHSKGGFIAPLDLVMRIAEKRRYYDSAKSVWVDSHVIDAFHKHAEHFKQMAKPASQISTVSDIAVELSKIHGVQKMEQLSLQEKNALSEFAKMASKAAAEKVAAEHPKLPAGTAEHGKIFHEKRRQLIADAWSDFQAKQPSGKTAFRDFVVQLLKKQKR